MEKARPTIKISSVILTAIAAAAAFADSSSGAAARKGCRHPWTISKSGLSRFSRNAATPLDPRAPSALQPGACALNGLLTQCRRNSLREIFGMHGCPFKKSCIQ